jgi:hypothetical protein
MKTKERQHAIYVADDPKGYEKPPPGTMPDARAVVTMMKYNKSLQDAAAGFTEMQVQSVERRGI